MLLNRHAGPDQPEDQAARLAQRCAEAGVAARVIPLASAADAEPAARSALDEGAAAVVAAGGDGTVNAVARVLAGTATPLGVIPLGTLNHFARDAGIPLDVDAAVATLAARQVRHVDVGDVNGHLFVNNASIGLYPHIVVHRESLERRGYARWIAMTHATASLLRRYRGALVTVRTPAAAVSARASFVLVGNNAYDISGFDLGARPRLDEGQLVAYVATSRTTMQLAGLTLRALLGRARNGDGYHALAADRLDVETIAATVRVAVDGEVMVSTAPLRFHIRPRALAVCVPAA